MSSPYLDHATFASTDHSFIPDTSPPSLGSVLLALVAGAYVLFKALEILGYPVRFWLYQLAHMAHDTLPSLDLPQWSFSGVAADPDADAGEDTQKTEMHASGGNVLKTVFGLNSGSLLKKGVTGLTGALSKSYSNVPPGLGNLSNSCYQNSVIQGLASLPSLTDYLSKTTNEYATLDGETTNGALFEMINSLNNPENHGRHFWIRGTLKSMSTFQQQDAQEYYSKVLDALDKEVRMASNSKRRSSVSWLLTAKNLSDLPVAATDDKPEDCMKENQTASEEPHVTPNPLDGLLAQRVGCTTCGYSEGLSLIPFNCLTVPLGRNYHYDVRNCLDEYTSLEYIEGVECAKCTLLRTKATLGALVAKNPGSAFESKLQVVQEALDEEDFDDKTLVNKCNVAKKNWSQSTKSRQAVIARAPKSLVLHVNRSIFDEMTGAQYKNNAHVSYPQILDLGNWCLGNKPSQSHLQDPPEEWPRDPNKSMLREPTEDGTPTTNSPFQYALRAVVSHSGTHGYGHYVCYRQHPKEKTESTPESEEEEVHMDQWWRFSDETVTTVSEEQALYQGNVFMLFYERLDAISPCSQSESIEVAATATSDEVVSASSSSQTEAMDINESGEQVPPPDGDADLEPAMATIEPPVKPSNSEEQPASPVDLIQTPQPELMDFMSATEDTEMSEADSEDAPSTQLTSDDEADTPLDKDFPQSLPHNLSPSPHMMRTAGDSSARDQGSRRSLPMVTAT